MPLLKRGHAPRRDGGRLLCEFDEEWRAGTGMALKFLRRHRWSVAAASVVLLGYVAVLCCMPRHVFWSPDEGGKFLELHSIRWQDGFTYTVPYAAQRIDPDFKFYPRIPTPISDTFLYPATSAQGNVIFHWPIWFPLLSSVMLRAFGLSGIYLIPLLSGWLIALVSGRIVHFFSPRLAPLGILLVGCATPVFFYSQCFWEHTLATLLGMLAVAILVAAPPGSRGALVTIVPPLLAAMMIRIEMVAFAAAAFLAWGFSGLVAGLRPGVAAEAAASSPLVRQSGRRLRWGSYLLLVCLAAGTLSIAVSTAPTRQQRFITTLPARIGATLRQLPHLPRSVVSVFVNTGRDEGPALNAAWVILACIAVGLCFVAPFVSSVRTEAAVVIPALTVVLAFSASVAVLDQEYRALHGIFPVAPFMVIWAYVLPDAWRRHDSRLLMLAGFAVLYLVLGCTAIFVFYVDAEGGLRSGLEWGQRYLLTLYPILTILSLLALRTYRKSTRPARLKTIFTVVVSTMMLIGVQQEVRGLAMLRANREKFAAWDRALRSDGPIVTNLWWLPTTLAPLFLTKEMSYVRSPTELGDWVRLAVAQEIPAFTFVSLGPVQDGLLANTAARRVPQASRAVLGLYLTRFDLAAGGSPATR